MSTLMWLDQDSLVFPPTHMALDEPDGLVAVGGDLSPDRLIKAYQKGIFPWFSDNQPIYWWTPSQRMTLLPIEFHAGRSLKKLAKRRAFTITVDKAFSEVIRHCAKTFRKDQDGTWITEEMQNAYIDLHHRGVAHSIEAWQDGRLVGGLYGIALGKVYFGESMFSLVSGASKIAFASLVQQLIKWQYELIDCQIYTSYLATFGAKEIPRIEFERKLKIALGANPQASKQFSWPDNWTMPEHGFE